MNRIEKVHGETIIITNEHDPRFDFPQGWRIIQIYHPLTQEHLNYAKCPTVTEKDGTVKIFTTYYPRYCTTVETKYVHDNERLVFIPDYENQTGEWVKYPDYRPFNYTGFYNKHEYRDGGYYIPEKGDVPGDPTRHTNLLGVLPEGAVFAKDMPYERVMKRSLIDKLLEEYKTTKQLMIVSFLSEDERREKYPYSCEQSGYELFEEMQHLLDCPVTMTDKPELEKLVRDLRHTNLTLGVLVFILNEEIRKVLNSDYLTLFRQYQKLEQDPYTTISQKMFKLTMSSEQELHDFAEKILTGKIPTGKLTI